MAVKIGYLILKRGLARMLALPRMGSFTSAPKILNDDNQDNNVHLPENITREELIQFCQKQPNVQPMVKRKFKNQNVNGQNIYAKFNIFNKLRRNSNLLNPNVFRVFQWNLLSQALGQMNDNFVRCPDAALEWDSRKYHIIEEIIEYSPDIICLQEVDHFNFLKHVLATQGYQGMFFPKPDSPCFYITGNNGPDGCAIFYRTEKFEMVQMESRILEFWRIQSNQVALLVILRMRETNQEICVITTHLKARTGALLSTLRNEQGKDLLHFAFKHCKNRPVILCGDFNAEPVEPIYNTVLTNELLNLGSAYADCNNKSNLHSAAREPPYTTWKIRDEGEICHTIDYVFYSKNCLEVDAVLEFPTAEDIGEDRVPSFSYPSEVV